MVVQFAKNRDGYRRPAFVFLFHVLLLFLLSLLSPKKCHPLNLILTSFSLALTRVSLPKEPNIELFSLIFPEI